MSVGDTRSSTPLWRLTVLVFSVILMSTALTWTYLGMRSVMDVGGSCADGGPYVSAQPCPDGATLLTIGIPLLLVAMFAGSAVAISLSAPTLLLPMWGFLFVSLGWNFLDYGITNDGVIVSWIVCGVLFMLMGLPALLLMFTFGGGKNSPHDVVSEQKAGRGTWRAVYVALAVIGVAFGTWSFNSWT